MSYDLGEVAGGSVSICPIESRIYLRNGAIAKLHAAKPCSANHAGEMGKAVATDSRPDTTLAQLHGAALTTAGAPWVDVGRLVFRRLRSTGPESAPASRLTLQAHPWIGKCSRSRHVALVDWDKESNVRSPGPMVGGDCA